MRPHASSNEMSSTVPYSVRCKNANERGGTGKRQYIWRGTTCSTVFVRDRWIEMAGVG